LLDNWKQLFAYAMRLTGDRDRAADLVQSSALRVLATSSAPASEESARVWLFAVVRNAWIDGYRKSKSDPQVSELGNELSEHGEWDYDNRLIAEITVRQAIERIEPAQREIIELIDIVGFRYAEAAEIMNLPIGTIMSRLSRARAALLEAIETGNIQPLVTNRQHAK
jgi:RNA polymerase sigma-70 factor (ECF subfamily)